MYLKHKILASVLFVLLSACSYMFGVKIEEQFASNIFSLIGILLGFTITAAVAMKGSVFFLGQSKKVDKQASGIHMTNAQRLCEYLDISAIADLALITLLCIVALVRTDSRIAIRIFDCLIVGLLGEVLLLSSFVLRLVAKYMRS